MRIRLKTKLLYAGIALSMVFASCDDFLDKKPLSSVTPDDFFNTDEDLAAYTIQMYPNVFDYHAGWGLGTLNNDVGTDDMVSSDEPLNTWKPLQWKVPENAGSWDFGQIRQCNYFFEKVLPKWKAGEISGNEETVKHYIGEMYFLRAWVYFGKLYALGDFPILTRTMLETETDFMTEASKRRPRNEVARFILEQLDTAVMYLKPEMNNKNRITKNVALLVKSRVALFEGSWLTYHKGTPFVPGGPGWPGASAYPNFSIDLDNEINFFLTEAMKAAAEVADKITLTPNNGIVNPQIGSLNMNNPYFDMFSAVDMSTYNEVLLWKAYNKDLSITHGVSVYIRNGGNNGLTKGLVDGFLMKNGLPIYASGSGYHGDQTLMDQKKDRDERLQLFMVGEDDVLLTENDSSTFGYPNILGLKEVRDVTGLKTRKCFSYDPSQAPSSELYCYYGSITFRGVEAYLNYMEACYIKNQSLDAKATAYWKAIRQRAGVDQDFNKTIAATDLSQENDWGAYSAGQLVDKTLFNIRRERRNEFIGEGMRLSDLKRWRAMDQVDGYIVEGFNLWDKAYLADPYQAKLNDKTGKLEGGLHECGKSEDPNVSAREDSKYLRPYRKSAKSDLYNGYKFMKAYYLDPIGARQFRLTATDPENASTSTIYQNPYWPTSVGPAVQ